MTYRRYCLQRDKIFELVKLCMAAAKKHNAKFSFNLRMPTFTKWKIEEVKKGR